MALLHVPVLLASILHLTHVHNNHSICEASISPLKEQLKQSQQTIQDWKKMLNVGRGKEVLLLYWSEEGDLGMVKKLLEMETNVSAQDSHLRTPLHLAAQYGHLEIARLLLDAGANTEIRNRHNNTPLIWAAHNNHLDVCNLLLDRGAKVNVYDVHKNTPLHYSAWFGYLPIVKLLVERGADVNAKNAKHKTPLQLAKNENQTNVVAWLQQH